MTKKRRKDDEDYRTFRESDSMLSVADPGAPEKRLIAAIILRAYADAILHESAAGFSPSERHQARNSALKWILSSYAGPQSFEWWCDLGNHSAEKIRNQLRDDLKNPDHATATRKRVRAAMHVCRVLRLESDPRTEVQKPFFRTKRCVSWDEQGNSSSNYAEAEEGRSE
jgi:hypothetical protein